MRAEGGTPRRGTMAILWIMAAAAFFRGNSINYVVGPAAADFGLAPPARKSSSCCRASVSFSWFSSPAC